MNESGIHPTAYSDRFIHPLCCEKKNTILLLLFLLPFFSIAQKEAGNWVFGSGPHISFNSGTPVNLTNHPNQLINEGSAAISDASGNLLFYTNGVKAYDKNHNQMPNGHSLLAWNNPTPASYVTSSTMAAVIVPMPGNSNKYYLFTAPTVTYTDGINYSIVDMTLNSGNGDIEVANKNINLLSGMNITEKIAAVKHFNGVDYWVVAHNATSSYYAWKITSAGVSPPVISTIGRNLGGAGGPGQGCMRISPNGKKIVTVFLDNIVELFDFDNSTGIICNPMSLSYPPPSNTYNYGACFSPDAKKLYIAPLTSSSPYEGRLIQFDITTNTLAAINASAIQVGSWNNGTTSLQLGLDGKIYISHTSGNSVLSTINSPNTLGVGCGFSYNSYALNNGAYTSLAFCNFVENFLVPDLPLQCSNQEKLLPKDTLINTCTTFSLPLSVANGYVSYLWSDGSTGQNITVTTAGKYWVRVNDGGCIDKADTIAISTASGTFTVTPSAVAASCGLSNGIATVTPSPAGSYTYNWSAAASGQTSASVINLASGTYTVTVDNGSGCSATTTVSVAAAGGATISSIAKNDALCFGGNGNATVSISGGVSGNYTYSWATGQSVTTNSTIQQINNLTTGTYTVTVIDGACSTTTVINITQPAAISFSTPTLNNASCGISNGNASVTASGGTGILNYSWSATELTNNINNKPAAAYVVTVTDINSCTATLAINIGNTGGATISSITKNDANCFGGNGNAIVNISGGVSGNYTYSWSNGVSTITTATSNSELLTSNSYTVTVIDGSCSSTSIFTINQPIAIIATAIQNTPATCGINNGIATVSATGGNNNSYNYVWSNGDIGITASALSAATYVVTITDGNLCTKTATVNISNSPAPTINSITPIDPLCNNGTGTASVNATGTGTLSYAWSNGNTGLTATNLSAGNHNVTVTDINGCKKIQSFSITRPTAIITNTVTINPAACGLSNGNAAVSASGGTGTLEYSWSATETTTTISNKPAGAYAVTVTDINSCTATLAVNIGSIGGAVFSNATTISPNCNGGNGSATVAISSGVSGNYTYSWLSGQSTITNSTTSQISNLISGTYTVTVIDGACSATTVVTITQPAAVSITNPITTNASCGQMNGSATITLSGGTGLYTYSWSNGITGITSNTQLSNTTLATGIFIIQITDANNCATSYSSNIGSTTTLPVAAANASPSAITEGETVLLSGGGGATYLWTPSSSLTCATCPITIATPPTTTTYTLIIKDILGCIDSTDITITVKKPCSGEEDVFIANVFSPNNDGKNDILTVQGYGLTNIYFTIYDRWGNNVFESRDQAQGWDGTQNGSAVNSGTYVYFLKGTCKKTNAEVILKGNVSVVK